MKHTRLAFIALLATLLALFGAGTATAAKPPAPAPVTAAVTDPATGFVGQYNITSFRVVDGALVAVGTLTGTLAGVQISPTAVQVPVNAAASDGSCQILDLVLGPLDLDLLGLEVHLDTVHLNITAQSGPGNLLGNLLCAVAGLLDGGLNASALSGLATLLNQILRILG